MRDYNLFSEMGVRLPAPGYGLRDAFEVAWEKLAVIDLNSLPSRAGVTVRDGKIEVNYLGSTVKVDRQTCEIIGEELRPREKLLVLHYLVRADGAGRAGKVINFPRIPGASGYSMPFRGRVIQRIMGGFGSEPEKLLERGRELGWSRARYGDASVEVRAFPKVSLFFVVWKGDDELPPEATVLFDENIDHYLDVEDVVVLCEEIVSKL